MPNEFDRDDEEFVDSIRKAFGAASTDKYVFHKKTTRRRALTSVSAVTALIAVVGFAPTLTMPDTNSAPERYSNSTTTNGSSGSSPHPTITCGTDAKEVARRLVDVFQATVLISTRINARPTVLSSTGSFDMTATPLQDVVVLAGVGTNGVPKEVVINDLKGTVLLPSGSYLIALNTSYTGLRPGQYVPAGGLSGTFVADGVNIFQRCPNYSKPGAPTAGPRFDQNEFISAFIFESGK